MTGIAYEPHPVSPERKKELRAKGMKIVDIRFKPRDAVEAEPEIVELSRVVLAGMRKADLKALADAKGIDASGKVDELRERIAGELLE